MTVVPEVPLGTAKVQLNAPVAPVVNEPDVHTVIVTPSNTNDANPVDTENPVPATVTVAPTGPWLGDTVIAGAVIVNGAVALSKLPSDPVAFTVYAVADAVPVIVTTQLNVPVPETVAPQLVVIVAPELTVVVTVTPGVNPVPETVTDAPLGPWVGVSVIAGVVTVNVPLPV